ncbi:MAG TPA: hypothetical protein VJT67_08975, partial [Longimicrobiaceae bacterium]|nr:hypothetical protein [Longimicrobiaceae bacterium]
EVNANIVTVQSASGLKLLLNELAWLSSAAMGASFAMLMQVSGYVVKRNYDPRYESSYWIKFFLGVMAGFILVQVLPGGSLTGGGTDPNVPQLLFALLGGFAASAVFRILNRLVDAVESVFRGDVKEQITRAEEAARSRSADEAQQVRVSLAAEAVKLQQEIASGASPEQLTQRLQAIVGSVLPETPRLRSPEADEQPAGTIALPADTPIVGEEAPAETEEPAAAATTAAGDEQP